MDDIRNHDARPTPDESQWMATDIVSVLFRAVVLAVVALSVGLSASLVIDQAHREPAVAARSAS